MQVLHQEDQPFRKRQQDFQNSARLPFHVHRCLLNSMSSLNHIHHPFQLALRIGYHQLSKFRLNLYQFCCVLKEATFFGFE